MNKRKTYLVWSTRILVCILFILSGVSKLFPVWAFEKQLVDLNLFSWCQAPYFARFIIAGELALGVAILQNHFIKRIVIPLTVFLLIIFCSHLSIQMVQFGPMNGNCGCFGQLIPMTPLEAFIKNSITILLLVYLYKNVTERKTSKWIVPILFFFVSQTAVFFLFPFKSCSDEEKTTLPVVPEIVVEQTDSVPAVNSIAPDTIQEIKKKDLLPARKKEVQAQSVHSRFSVYKQFENKKVNLDEGKKIVCMFAAGCDHCRETAKAICKLAQQKKFPEVYILFMNEETFLIDDFFNMAVCRFPYQILDIPQFWNLLGTGKTTPGIFFLLNGTIVKEYEGIDKNKFNAEEFKKILDSK